VRPQDIFEICYARYRSAKKHIGAGHAALDPNQPAGYQWRPERVRAAEYVADFELIGRRALNPPSWEGRRRLFEIYFVWMVPYRRAIVLVGVATGTFDWWMQQVKQTVGRALDRAGLFPPAAYFRKRSREG
jgi:hypothetical protein